MPKIIENTGKWKYMEGSWGPFSDSHESNTINIVEGKAYNLTKDNIVVIHLDEHLETKQIERIRQDIKDKIIRDSGAECIVMCKGVKLEVIKR